MCEPLFQWLTKFLLAPGLMLVLLVAVATNYAIRSRSGEIDAEIRVWEGDVDSLRFPCLSHKP